MLCGQLRRTRYAAQDIQKPRSSHASGLLLWSSPMPLSEQTLWQTLGVDGLFPHGAVAPQIAVMLRVCFSPALSGICMHVRRCCTWVIAMALAGSAIAQSANTADHNPPCSAEKAEIERRMELARSKGQMLLRRQLADQLGTLQAGCKPLPADQGRVANIERLEKEVRSLKAELDAAEEQLRKLKSEVSR